MPEFTLTIDFLKKCSKYINPYICNSWDTVISQNADVNVNYEI